MNYLIYSSEFSHSFLFALFSFLSSTKVQTFPVKIFIFSCIMILSAVRERWVTVLHIAIAMKYHGTKKKKNTSEYFTSKTGNK